MSREKEIIEQIARNFPRSNAQLNKLFEADAEILKFGGQQVLVNVDEFSDEDLLRDDEPYSLGWNLAVGGLTDIYATGGKPLFYAHSLVISRDWSEEYLQQFTHGISDILKKAQVYFIGGDLGFSESWRYTITAIGVLEGKPLLRSNAKVGDKIYLTGRIGTGNLEAYLKLFSTKKIFGGLVKPFKNHFQLRISESILIRKYANACIDTSDGVFNALNTLAELSGTGFEVSKLPYLKTGVYLAKMFSLPEMLLFFGECGEYELLFTINEKDEVLFLKEAKQNNLLFYELGRITESSIKRLVEKNQILELSSFNYRARDYENIRNYLQDIIEFIQRSINV